MTVEPTLARRTVITVSLWLAAWLAAAAWLVFDLATRWPYVGSSLQLLLVFAVAGLVFRGFDLSWYWRRRAQVQGWRRWLARLLALVAGVLVGGGLCQALEATSLSSFASGIAPFVRQVQANAAAPCPPAARYVADEQLRAYLEGAGKPAPRATLYHDGKRVVIAFPGGSADIDGSTVWTEAAAPVWKIFHNDKRGAADAFDALVKGMQSCRVELR